MLPQPWQAVLLGTPLCHISYVNHSDDPNTRLAHIPPYPMPVLITTRLVDVHEELSFNYEGWLPRTNTYPQQTDQAERLDGLTIGHGPHPGIPAHVDAPQPTQHLLIPNMTSWWTTIESLPHRRIRSPKLVSVFLNTSHPTQQDADTAEQ